MIYIAGITIAVFFEFLLLSKKNKSEPDKILAIWMLLIIIHLSLIYLFSSGAIHNFPFLWGVELPIPLLHGVMLYLYVASMTNQLPQNRKLLFLHFLPAAAMYVYLVSFLILPVERKDFVYKNYGAGYEVFTAVRLIIIIISGIIYVIWSHLLLRKHRQNILSRFSYKDKINLQWLQILISGTIGIWLLIFLFFRNDVFIFMGVVVFVFMIGFFGIRHVKIFDGEKEIPDNAERKAKYSKSGLTKELSEKLYAELLRLMNEDLMFRKNDLATNDLASKLNVHPNYLSQIINEREGKNFYDFINQYRIEAFIKLISDPKNRNTTLLSMAFDCGFNSKSSFNRNFKKVIGKTPSEYFDSLTIE